MTSFSSSPQRSVFITLVFVLSLVCLSAVSCQIGDWEFANATSSMNGQDLAGCGFENQTEYQGKTVAISTTMYRHGQTCGACFEIKCNGSSNCIYNTIKVTAVESCAASYFNGTRNWCQEPQKHFELQTSIFSSISKNEWAVIPVQFRRVTCVRKGGVRFKLIGNDHSNVGVMVYNVGGNGDVVDLKMKGLETKWVEMINGDDQRWVTVDKISSLSGQSLSFKVTSSNGEVVEAMNVAPKDWKFGETYEGGQF